MDVIHVYHVGSFVYIYYILIDPMFVYGGWIMRCETQHCLVYVLCWLRDAV